MFTVEPARSQLWLNSGDTDGKHWEKLLKRAREHPLNHAVDVFVPGLAELPAELSSLEPPVYYTSQLPLSHFIKPHIRSCVSSLSLCALTPHARIDTDCVYALLPPGKLVLSVDKDTYEQLGLVGKPSRFQKRHRFVVEVDLLADHFRPGKQNYDHVKWSFEERLGDSVHFVLCHSAADGEVGGEFLAQHHKCLTEGSVLYDFHLPTIRCHLPHGEPSTCCRVTDFHTWLGALTCGINPCREGGCNIDYVSRYRIPDPYTACQYGTRARWTGMVHSEWICNLLSKAKSVLKSDREAGSVPWIAVSVWGFEDSPVSWGHCEHGSFMWGDNHYVVVLFREGHHWTITSLGTHDTVS